MSTIISIKYIILSTFNLVKSGDVKSVGLIKLLYEIDTSLLFLTLSSGWKWQLASVSENCNKMLGHSKRNAFKQSKLDWPDMERSCILCHEIHLIPKWQPINYSFVCRLISPLHLIFTSKFFCFLFMLMRQRGLINMQTKE